MHQAQLHFRLRIDRLDCVWEAGQAIHAGDEHVFQPTRLPTSFLSLYSICYAEFSIALSLYFINQHITGHHRIDVEAIPCAPEQIKTLKTSKPFRNASTSVDS